MLKIVAAGVTAFFIVGTQLAYAQVREMERATAADVDSMSDARANIVKAALQLTPDQEKLWPAVEDAMRARAKDRKARIENMEKAAAELRGHSLYDVLSERNPADFLNRRADALSHRAADLKKLADAWQPLYQTFSPEQKKRLAHVEMVVLREMKRALEHRRVQAEEEDEE
jgi:hypothetical protein